MISLTRSRKVRVYCWVSIKEYEILEQKRKELKKKYLSDLVASLLCEAMKRRGWTS